MPYYSWQFFTNPYCSIWILAIPYTSLQCLPNHQYERFCHSVHNTKGSAPASAWTSSGVEPASFDWVFLGKMVVNHVLLATLHRCIFNIPKEDDENYPSQTLGLRWVVFLGCRSVCLFSLIQACLQGSYLLIRSGSSRPPRRRAPQPSLGPNMWETICFKSKTNLFNDISWETYTHILIFPSLTGVVLK